MACGTRNQENKEASQVVKRSSGVQEGSGFPKKLMDEKKILQVSSRTPIVIRSKVMDTLRIYMFTKIIDRETYDGYLISNPDESMHQLLTVDKQGKNIDKLVLVTKTAGIFADEQAEIFSDSLIVLTDSIYNSNSDKEVEIKIDKFRISHSGKFEPIQ